MFWGNFGEGHTVQKQQTLFFVADPLLGKEKPKTAGLGPIQRETPVSPFLRLMPTVRQEMSSLRDQLQPWPKPSDKIRVEESGWLLPVP